MADRPLSAVQLPIATAAAGITNLVAGVAEYDIVIVALHLNSDGNETVELEDETGNLDTFYLGNTVQVVLPECGPGWCRAVSGQTLRLNLTNGGVNVRGTLVYRMVPDHMEL